MYRARVVSYSGDTGTNGTISEGGQSQDSAQFRHAADHKSIHWTLINCHFSFYIQYSQPHSILIISMGPALATDPPYSIPLVNPILICLLTRKLWRNLVDRAAQSGDNIHKQFSEFSSDLTHFKYGEVRNKRHHKGRNFHCFFSVWVCFVIAYKQK